MMQDDAFAKQRRKNVRLAEYDYSTPGEYFVTLCTPRNNNLFGKISDGAVQLNQPGEMVVSWWKKIPEKYPNIQLDSFIVMPDHLHGVICILEPGIETDNVGADPCVRPETQREQHKVRGLPEIIRWFKTMTTNEYIRRVKSENWQRFDRYLWQRSYYEHVIRRVENINEVREYILNNPLRWELYRTAR